MYKRQLYPYFSGGGDISLQSDNMTLKLAKGGVYLFSFSASATVNAGGYFKITPVIGVSDEGVYAFTAQSKTVSAAISVANTFLFYAPVDFYLRLKLNASEPVRPVGHLDVVRISDYPLSEES